MPPRRKDVAESIPEIVAETSAEMVDTVIEPPTLHDAFYVLCTAMETHLEDNQPAYMLCREIQAWYMNGNHQVAYQRAIQLLEGILGVPLGKNS